MEEIWKDIGIKKYAISNLGNVRGQDGIRLLKPAISHHGYKYVIICNDGIQKHKMIHHLVIEAFVGERPNGYVTDHINRIRDDNRLENLRYCSCLENSMNAKNYNNDILLHGKERYKELSKLYYQQNKDKRLQYRKQYWENNKEKIKEYQRNYRQKKKENE
jgi:hypothetical protein